MLRTAMVVLFHALVSTSILAQQTQQTYVQTFEVRLHNLDVIVTDAKGNPVRGLTREDFVVEENGAVQEVTNFSAYDASAATATAIGNGQVAPSAAEAPAPRRFVFFVDEIGLQKATRDRLIARAAELARTLRPEDRATIVRPTDPHTPVLDFRGGGPALETALTQAIESSGLNMIAGSYPEVFEFQRVMARSQSVPEWRYARRVYADAARRRVTHRLGQIRALVDSLAGSSDRKVLVLITMGLSTQPGREAWDYGEQMTNLQTIGEQTEDEDSESGNSESELDDPERVQGSNRIVGDFTHEIADIGRIAAANGVTIYGIEPDISLGLEVHGRADVPTRKDALGHFGNDPRAELPREFNKELLQNTALTMTELTDSTGGRWSRGLNGIGDVFRQIREDIDTYYSMAYRASGNADTARRVRVTVRGRPDLRVRTRREVMEKSTDREMNDLVVASLLYPREVNELEISASAGKPESVRGLFMVPLEIAIPMKRLTFLPSGDGDKYVATFTLHFAAAGVRSNFVRGAERNQKLEITREQYENFGDAVYRYRTGMEVAPGKVRFAFGILDETSQLSGFQTLEVMAE